MLHFGKKMSHQYDVMCYLKTLPCYLDQYSISKCYCGVYVSKYSLQCYVKSKEFKCKCKPNNIYLFHTRSVVYFLYFAKKKAIRGFFVLD